ncbi:ABC transporter permease [Cellulosilyticum ruminicola]|uniref:ABC transporter permease n=1 Tax=Cellulosilyticum ruminicola TaxID=425254 RepID=UPI0006D26DCC|nr:ABC transporter permease [Cellulosilyticum ruminicola]
MTILLNKELKSYFTSPIGYVFMCFFLLIFGLYFTAINVFHPNGNYTYVISSLSNMLLFTVPILTMRLLSEERKNRTDQLLITAPITVTSIVLGKYLAATTLLLITLAITFIHPILLMTLGTIPLGSILCSYLGFFLLGCTLISIGLFISALTENQIVAAIGSIGAFMFLLLADGIATLIPTSRLASLVFLLIVIAIISLIIYNA